MPDQEEESAPFIIDDHHQALPSSSMRRFLQNTSKPYTSLIIIFVVAKTILLLLAFLSPGIGYDTSTALLLRLTNASDTQSSVPSPAFTWSEYLALKLMRWDAIYFVSAAHRGYLFEQEWAFGWGYAKLVAGVTRLLHLPFTPLVSETYSAILVSNTSHLLAVLTLYRLTSLLTSGTKVSSHVPFISACLHIFAPAGIFLVAPYGESTFSFLSFLGHLAYVESKKFSPQQSMRGDLMLVLAGAVFGISATVRSNALLNGLIFAYDAVLLLPILPQLLTTVSGFRHGVAVALGGSLIAVGFALPQYIAYKHFCIGIAPGAEIREWCARLPPSIYTFVQSRYWGVGFLHYWTLSNIPLFALAVPMLSIMFYSGISMFPSLRSLPTSSTKSPSPPTPPIEPQLSQLLAHERTAMCLRRIALPTVVLVPLAITNFHVQIITRLAAAYPTVYLWLATRLVDESLGYRHGGGGKAGVFRSVSWTQVVVRFMVMYAIIQGGLFASFLQPA